MKNIIKKKTILELKDNFDMFIFDMWGVIWDGNNFIGNVQDTMSELMKSKKDVLIMSNSSEPEEKIETYSAKHGLIRGVHFSDIFSSGGLARNEFSNFEKKFKVYCFNQPNNDVFNEANYIEVETPEDADYVFIGRPRLLHEGTWKPMIDISAFKNELHRFKKLEKKLLCINPDLECFTADLVHPIVQHGSIAKYYKEIGGDVIYYGKPHKNIYDYAISEIKNKDRVLMIGDTLYTDILGGKNYGIKTALTCTGISMLDAQNSGFNDLATFAISEGIIPDYIIQP